MTDYEFRLRTELFQAGATHVIESTFEPVYTDERSDARDDFMARHHAALIELTKWIDRTPVGSVSASTAEEPISTQEGTK